MSVPDQLTLSLASTSAAAVVAEHVVDRSRVVMIVLVVVSGTVPEQAADASLRGTGRDLVPECADLIGHESGLSRCIRTFARTIEMSPCVTISISFAVGCVIHGCRLFLDWPLETPEQELARLRARVRDLEDSERKLNTERDILRAAAKYFAGETNW